MALNRERIHGKMEYWEPIALLHQTQTSLTSFKLRIRSVPTHIFHQLNCTELLEGLGGSMFTPDLEFQYLIHPLMGISLYLWVIGTRSTIRYYNINFSCLKYESLIANSVSQLALGYIFLCLKRHGKRARVTVKDAIEPNRISFRH